MCLGNTLSTLYKLVYIRFVRHACLQNYDFLSLLARHALMEQKPYFTLNGKINFTVKILFLGHDRKPIFFVTSQM